MDLIVNEAQWGQQIHFEQQQTVESLKKLVEFQKKILSFLRTGEMLSIKNNEIVPIRTKIYSLISDQKKETFNKFYLDNIRGLVNEFSEGLQYYEDEQFAKIVSQKWIGLKQFIFWMTFFFQNLEENKNVSILYSQAGAFLKELYYEKQKEQLFKTIKNLTDIERVTFRKQEFHVIQNLVQIILVCGIKNLMISKIIDENNNQLDTLQFHSKEDKILVINQYYLDNFQNPFIEYIEQVYQKYYNEWSQLYNTPDYIDMCLQTLQNEDLICNSYFPFSKQSILQSIHQIVIVQYAKSLINCENHGVVHMLRHKRYHNLRNVYLLFKRVSRITVNQEEEKRIQEQNKKLSEEERKKILEKQTQQLLQQQQTQKISQEKCKHPIDELKDMFFNYIKHIGDSINANSEVNQDPILYFKKILDLKEEIDEILNKSLFTTENKADYEFSLKKDEAFKYIFMSFTNAARFLSAFCDQYLNAETAKQYTEDIIQKFINQLKTLIHYINDKDLFFSEYQRLLCYRLLQEKVYNSDVEKQIISSFKMDHGKTSTKCMEQMIGDMQGQKENQKDFFDYIKENKIELEISEFSVIVLQKSSWPLGVGGTQEIKNFDEVRRDQVYIPKILENSKIYYQEFYKKIKGDKIALEWYTSEGYGQLDYQNNKKNNYQFLVSTHQMIILLAFNQQDQLNVQNINDITNISKKEIEKNLIHFTKFKLLEVQPPFSKENIKVTQNHVFTVNGNFETKLKRSNLMFKKKVITDIDVQKQTMDNLKREREQAIDAAVVRIMKSRRTLDFNSLITETYNIIRLFKPDVPSIKQRIESLIERDYLVRDEKERSKFIYKP